MEKNKITNVKQFSKAISLTRTILFAFSNGKNKKNENNKINIEIKCYDNLGYGNCSHRKKEHLAKTVISRCFCDVRSCN